MSARYRIGTTSFVHPAGWLENARRVAGRVSDVEILLFEPPVGASAPSAGEIAALARLGEEAGLTYSVHAPLEIALGSEDGGRRRAAVDAVRAAVEVTAPLAPHALIVHLAAGEREGGPLPVDPAAFRRRAIDSLHEVLSSGLAPATLCLETLEYDFALAEPVVEELGLSVAVDVGHLARDGVPIDAVLARNLGRARVVQWHGTDASRRDHRSLRHFPRAEAVRLVRALRAAEWAGVLTLEVFREADLDDSLAVLAELEQEAAA
ncbi:MAG TPA: cobamide remodeling phosphodiesterase CbiR [Anaeromyxobacter sp.]